MTDKIKNWSSQISKLSCVKRFSQANLAKSENVLEHTCEVSLHALFIATELKEEGYEIDIGSVLSKSLVHDLEETEIGDVARPFKYSSPELRDKIKELEDDIAADMFHKCSSSKDLFFTWVAAKDDSDGAIVSFCDTLVVMLKFDDEIIGRGNNKFLELMSEHMYTTLFDKLYLLDGKFPGSKTIRDIDSFCNDMKEKMKRHMEKNK